MDFNHVVRIRKSVRKFKNKGVDFRNVLHAIDIANQGPFPQNHNHFKFIIIEDPKKIGKLAELSDQIWIATAPMVVVLCSDDSTIEGVYGTRGRIYSRQSAGATIYSFILKLADLGIGSCWVGSYDDGEVKKFLSVPENLQIEAIIPLGFSEDSSKKSHKKNLEGTIFWEKWGSTRRSTMFEELVEEIHPPREKYKTDSKN